MSQLDFARQGRHSLRATYSPIGRKLSCLRTMNIKYEVDVVIETEVVRRHQH